MADEKVGENMSLKVLVDKERKRVVFAESDNKFVDILFSFLTLPMGTVVRLLRDTCKTSTAIGSMTTLYESVEKLDVQNFRSAEHKSMLLHLKNPSQAQCRKLKLNIDDTEPYKYYTCATCPSDLVTTSPNEKCRSGCGKLSSKEWYLADDVRHGDNEIFAKETARFIVTDDLQVMPSSEAISLELFHTLGVRDISALEEKIINLGLQEVLHLLRLSLLSKTPLTNLFLLNNVVCSGPSMHVSEIMSQPEGAINTSNNFKEITLKLVVRKSNSKVLYAEAQEDFVNYLFNFPAITLGSMAKVLYKNCSLGCISNLYKSVESLAADRYMKSSDVKAKLLSPKLGIQSLNPNYNCFLLTSLDNPALKWVTRTNDVYENPDPPALETIGNIGIVKGPATYLVTDDLVVTLPSPISTISVLNRLKISMHDLEVRVVTFGKEEALKLLEASLISKTPLTLAFNSKVSEIKPKLEK